MLRRIWMVLFAVLLLPYLGAQAAAAEETGSIRVTLQNGEQPVAGGEVMLYQVGVRLSEGYRLEEAFGGGMVREEDALSPYLAQWLAELDVQGGMPRILDADGSAAFSRLEQGLYLLVQTATEDEFYIRPFLIALPCEGEWNVELYPELLQIAAQSPPTGQHPAPIIAAMGMVLSGVGLVLCADRRRRK